jgi:hypothetical protein
MERKKGDGAKGRRGENLLGRGEQVRRRPRRLNQENPPFVRIQLMKNEKSDLY